MPDPQFTDRREPNDGIYLVRMDGILMLAQYDGAEEYDDENDCVRGGWTLFGDATVIPDQEFKANVIVGPLEPIDFLKLHKDLREERQQWFVAPVSAAENEM